MKKIVSLAVAIMLSVSVFSGCSSDSEVGIKSSADVKGLDIAVQENTTGHSLAEEMYPDSEISKFKKAIDCGMDLQNGKVDAVIIDEQVAKKIVEQLPDLMILDEKLSEEEYAIAVQKGNTELLDAINATLADMNANGDIDMLYNAFIPPAEDQEPLEEFTVGSYDEDLVMGTNAEFEPFEYRNEEGEIVGYDVEIAKRIADSVGKNLKIEDMNFDSLIAAVTSGKIDMAVAGMTVNNERLESVDFSDSYFNAAQVIIVRKASYEMDAE